MSNASPLSSTGPTSYSYTGQHSYSYTGQHSYSYSQPMEPYGFDGNPGNGMLAAALASTRSAIRRAVFPPLTLGGGLDVGGGRQWNTGLGTALPAADAMTDLGRCGVQPRTSMALLELLSSVQFAPQPARGSATLHASSGGGTALLVSMTRPVRSYFEGQLKDVDSWSASRDTRAPEILTQVAPPLAYFAAIMNLQAGRHRRTLEFLTMSLQFAYAVCMRFKQAMNCPRPSEYSAGIMPMLEVPPHRSLPAGHAVEAHVTASLLATLAGMNGPALMPWQALRRLAHRIAENREIAGLHFPIDNVAGRLTGDALASYVLSAASPANVGWSGGEFDGSNAQALGAGVIEADSPLVEQVFAGPGCQACASSPNAAPVAMPVLRQMWLDAQREWDQ